MPSDRGGIVAAQHIRVDKFGADRHDATGDAIGHPTVVTEAIVTTHADGTQQVIHHQHRYYEADGSEVRDPLRQAVLHKDVHEPEDGLWQGPINGLTSAYANLVCSAMIGTAFTAYSNANAYLGVGDSSTAFAISQTGLQAATNKAYLPMNASYPSVSTNVITFQGTAATGTANYAWNEVCVLNGNGTGTMMFRVVVSLGTKTNTSTWQLTVTETTTPS